MAYYDSIAKGYNELHKEEQINKLDIIKKNIRISKRTRLLDVGCGTGLSSEFDCFVVSIDPSIKLLKQNKNDKKLLSVTEMLPFKNSSFDYVISVTAIHNFKNIKKGIGEMKRVGKGDFIFSVLRKSGKFGYIKKMIEKNFKIGKALEEDKDVVFFCSC